ncbi:MAG: VIT1/CCC1 transporter family protein [Candidatus Pacebacteria bacterium]|jgi:vacuolar iron transporter family protein|nr:VIT1/CCC1 transporter family protein [Candidatus Paceibacterota bacterium]
MPRPFSATYFKSFVFGVEDSLVSTVGLLSGVALAGVSSGTVILTGIVLIFVEAFSMAAGEFLSESETEEYQKQGEVSSNTSVISSIIMFFSYLVSGFIPLVPYLVIADASVALYYSVGMSLGALCILGVIGAYISRTSYLRHALQMVLIGGAAIAVGIIAGQVVGV